MARSEGVPVIKLHLDKELVGGDFYDGGNNIEPYLKALFEAMKTKPKSVERTITYYPEAVVLKGKVEGYGRDAVYVRES